MIFIPYRVETLTVRSPWANLIIIAATTIVSAMAMAGALSESAAEAMVLSGWSPAGLGGHMLLHAGWLHLFGNMLMLFVFGNAVCGVMGQFAYMLLYIGVGLAGGAAHLLLDGSPAIGASGAVCGVMGVYLAVYPTNRVCCFWMWLVRTGTVEISGWLLVGGYFALDLLGALSGGGQTAYWAHIGGTVIGFVTGLSLLKLGRIELGDYDHPTALEYISRRQDD
jgi:membrane associated rhomboid family serine protease